MDTWTLNGALGEAARGPRQVRFGFTLLAVAVLGGVIGLTVVHFMLRIGGVGAFWSDVAFLAGLAIAGAVLLIATRLVRRATTESFSTLQKSYLGSIRALSEALDSRDEYTSRHAAEVDRLALQIGQSLGMEEDELEALRLGAMFHDIGKIGIPDAVLNKPGPLDAAERALMRQHPQIGERILAPLSFLAPILPIVRHEHERWDGAGYPDGLRGEEIPLGARIIFVCDAYHAMTSDRPYRRSLGPEEAARRLGEGSGTQFDPSVVERFLESLEGAGSPVGQCPDEAYDRWLGYCGENEAKEGGRGPARGLQPSHAWLV